MTQLPLEGCRVIELAQLIAGPTCAMLLADLGADVIKVEPPGSGDASRSIYSATLDGEGVLFLTLNRNKRSLALDLASPRGREVLHRLAERADVVITGFRGGVPERLGLDYATLAALNPRLIYCAISGFGPDGPYRAKPALDALLQAMGGIMAITGEEGGAPALCGTAIADVMGALLASQGILTALLHRERTGRGQRVDLALLDGMVFACAPRLAVYFATGKDLAPLGSGHSEVVPYQAFRAKDGWLFVTVWADKGWPAFARAIGRPELATDPRFDTMAARRAHRGELRPILEAVFAARTVGEWLEILERADVLCAPVHRFSDLVRDPQVLANRMIVEQEHPRAGRIRTVGFPIKLAASPGTIRTPAPGLGEHSEAILGEAGYSPSEIAGLRAAGVAG